MIRRRFVLAILAFAMPATYASEQQSEFVLIENVNVIDIRSGEITENTSVLLGDDQIKAVGKTGVFTLPTGAMRFDAKGRFLIPGLIDTHVHPAWHTDESSRISADEALESLYLSRGVTGIRDASIQGQEVRALQAKEDAKSGARLLPRIHVSGRVDTSNIAKQGVANVAELVIKLDEIGVDSFKIRNGITLSDLHVVTGAAQRSGKAVWGHTYSGLDDYSDAALRAGVIGITHILGIDPTGNNTRPIAPPPLEEWQAAWIYGATNWLYEDKDRTTELIELMLAKNAWLEPTLVTEYFATHPQELEGRPGNAYLRTDYKSIRLGFPEMAGQDLANYRAAFENMKDFVRRFYEAGGWLIAGSDGLPWEGEGLHLEMELLVDAGIPPIGALQAATINAAKALGWNNVGAVEPGMQADLVLLDANPLEDIKNTSSIHAVITCGRWLRRSQLDEMLSRLATVD